MRDNIYAGVYSCVIIFAARARFCQSLIAKQRLTEGNLPALATLMLDCL